VGKGAPNPTLGFILIWRAVPTSIGRRVGKIAINSGVAAALV